jgi:DNA repair exonuclease SbcCD ATPase subunit
MNTKVCTKCKEEKPLTEFNKCRRNQDGLQSHCKNCQKKYRQENREQKFEYNKQYRQENREKLSELSKQYRQENREKLSELNKQWYQENREQKLEYCRRWRQDYREKCAAYRSRRRALERNGVPDFLKECPAEKQRLVQIYKLRDLLTEATGVEHHVDHIWPLSKGGPHWSGNLQIITAEENLSKSDTFCEETARVIQEALDEYCCFRYGE